MPLAAVSAIAAVVGTGLQMAGNAEAQSAQNDARAKAVAQQAELQKKAQAVAQQSIAKSTPQVAADQMAKGTAARQTAWQNLNTATQPIASALPATTDAATSGANKRATSSANAWNTLNAQAAAKEGGYGDWENQQAIKNNDVNQQLGTINNFSAGDAALLPTELQVASHAGDSLSTWGSVVGMLGSLAGAAGSMGGGSGSLGAPSSSQLNALAAGQGPVNAATAAATPASTLARGANAWSGLNTATTLNNSISQPGINWNNYFSP
jgi:hypothetical protein